jgi:hypothetical protein
MYGAVICYGLMLIAGATLMKKTDEVPVSLSSLEEVKTIGKFL